MIHHEQCKIISNEKIAQDLYQIIFESDSIAACSKCGQFVHIKVNNNACDPLLRRPISISDINDNKISLIYKVVGKGTSILTNLLPNDFLDVLCPLGNGFEIEDNDNICYLVGGGIGIAPLILLAKELYNQGRKLKIFLGGQEKKDIIDSFFLPELNPDIFITTMDGSLGEQGLITKPLEKELEFDKDKNKTVYACGPDKMLQAVGELAKGYNTAKIYLSMENQMGCAVGVCLGCVVDTVRGKERVCKEGPVFEYDDIVFAENGEQGKQGKASSNQLSVNSEGQAREEQGEVSSNQLSVISEGQARGQGIKIAGLTFKNPVITASGTFGYGIEYKNLFDIEKLGGITVKGVSLNAWEGNKNHRISETPSGIINAIGLQNLGVDDFIKNKLPKIKDIDTNIIVNISGHSINEYAELTEKLSNQNGIDALEINVSCPNISKGGACFGTSPEMVLDIVSIVRKHTNLPIIVKLTPNVTSIVEIALACEQGGADAVSLINTLLAMSIDINTKKPVLGNIMGGLSGPAIKPVAIRMVWQIYESKCTLPIIGMGGIMNTDDAIEFILAGASIIACGTGTFVNPKMPIEIVSGINKYMQNNNFTTFSEMIGFAHN